MHTQKNFFLILLIGGLALMFFILLPYLEAIVLAVTFAVLFRPLYKKFLIWTEESNKTSALLTIFVVLSLVFIPLGFLGFQVFVQATNLYNTFSNGGGSLSEALTQLQQTLAALLPFEGLDIHAIVRQGASLIAGNLGNIFSVTLSAVVGFFIMIILLYYLLKDGDTFRESLVQSLPLESGHTNRILTKLELAINSIIKGSLLVAIVQGIVSGIGFAIFGVPEPLLWGSIAALAALIPGIGTALVLTPAILYLFFIQSIPNAIGLLVWGIVAVGLIDNVLGPYLIEKGIKISPIFILLSVLGGVSFFGPVGFLIGPLVLSFVVALLEIYPSIFKHS